MRAVLAVTVAAVMAFASAPAMAYVFWEVAPEQTATCATNIPEAVGIARDNGSGADDHFILLGRTGCEVVDHDLGPVDSIAVERGHIYFGDQDQSTIERATLGGRDLEKSFIRVAVRDRSDYAQLAGLSVDKKYIFWLNPDLGAIGRANIDGLGVTQKLVSAGVTLTGGVAADNRYLYWGGMIGGGSGLVTIGRATVDGRSVAPSFIDLGEGQGLGISSVAVGGGRIYWYDSDTGTIGVADANGTHVDNHLVDTGNSQLLGLAVGVKHLYWTDYEDGLGGQFISRCDLDGSHVQVRFIPGSENPLGVAVNGPS